MTESCEPNLNEVPPWCTSYFSRHPRNPPTSFQFTILREATAPLRPKSPCGRRKGRSRSSSPVPFRAVTVADEDDKGSIYVQRKSGSIGCKGSIYLSGSLAAWCVMSTEVTPMRGKGCVSTTVLQTFALFVILFPLVWWIGGHSGHCVEHGRRRTRTP